MAKKEKRAKSQEKNKLITENLSKYGGNKTDMDIINMSDDEEDIECKHSTEDEPIKKSEIEAFIESLDFDQVMETIPEDDERYSFNKAKSPETSENNKESQSEATLTDMTKPPKKKKQNKFKLQDNEISSTSDTLPVVKEEQGSFEHKTYDSMPLVKQEPDPFKKKTSNIISNKQDSKSHIEMAKVNTVGLNDTMMLKSISGYNRSYKPRTQLLIKTVLDEWYDNGFPNDPTTWQPISENCVEQMLKYTQMVYKDELSVYSKGQSQKKNSEASWLRTAAKSGTLSDKMAAMTVLLQESPVHNLTSLETLVNMTKKKGKREAIMALDTLKDLFLKVLPSTRKLKKFEQHPHNQIESLTSGNRDSRDKRLLLWYFEDQLKKIYESFVKSLETISHDTLLASKVKALGTCFRLLSEKPEQEKPLLVLLVDKLGDPDQKLASKAVFLLNKLITIHPRMKQIVCLEVERILYRPNISTKAQYYCVCFLNQLYLTREDSKLASRLVIIYFSFFKSFVKRKAVDSKMLAGLLSGVNRAYPFAQVEQTKIEEHVTTLYKLVHDSSVPFNTALQALSLLYQVVNISYSNSERFYTALYKKMTDPSLRNSSKQGLFLNLIFKSVKKDTSPDRIKAFIKRLLQICCNQSVSFICGTLFMLSEVLKLKKNILVTKQIEKEVFEETNNDLDDEGDEHFTDAPIESEPNIDSRLPQVSEQVTVKTEDKKQFSWMHRVNRSDQHKKREFYDVFNRNPIYSMAGAECVWELERLVRHFHPTVSLFAKNLLHHRYIQYEGDPMVDFTLIRFLDRFVYRNPKKNIKKNEEESESTTKSFNKKKYNPTGVKTYAVNSDEFVKQSESSIPVDDRFFYKYFRQKYNQAQSKKMNEPDSDAESLNDEEFDRFMDKLESGIDGESEMPNFSRVYKTKKKSNKKQKPEDESFSDLDSISDLSDEEPEFDLDDADLNFDVDTDEDEDIDNMKQVNASEMMDAEEFESLLSDSPHKGVDSIREEDIDFSSDDDKFSTKTTKKTKRKKSLKSMSKPKKGKTSHYATAEEFSSILEENSSSKHGGRLSSAIGTEAMANKDNAHVKQLNWEINRDKWVRGQDWKTKKSKTTARQKRNNLSKTQKGIKRKPQFKKMKTKFR